MYYFQAIDTFLLMVFMLASAFMVMAATVEAEAAAAAASAAAATAAAAAGAAAALIFVPLLCVLGPHSRRYLESSIMPLRAEAADASCSYELITYYKYVGDPCSK